MMVRGRAIILTLVIAIFGVGALLGRVFAAPPFRPSLAGNTIVTPRPTLPLKFSHKVHASEATCEECHVTAKGSFKSSDLLVPGHKQCVECHDEEVPTKPVSQLRKINVKHCKMCHTQVDPSGKVARVKWPAPRFRFPHKLHVGQKIACTKCHVGMKQAGPATKPGRKLHIPKMSVCLDCHKGGKRGTRRCAGCHEKRPGGKVRTHFPGGTLKPGPSLPHIQHGPLFRTRHKTAARAHGATCSECHEKSTCLKCHGGVRKPASIHLGNYILRHGREARANRQRCQACHTRQRFCSSCHSRLGVAKSNTRSPFVIPGARRFHGANWSSTTSTSAARNRHATHARRNAAVCASCHKERDCTSCHARRRIGGLGRNPHGPGFRNSRRCRVLQRKNRRACLKCHGFRDPLMTLCR